MAKPSNSVVDGLTSASNFWFGITMSVSTFFRSFSMPSSACRKRRLPSKANGFVTIPTTRDPCSLAMRATDAAPPVPVPPPIPTVMKTISLPASKLAISFSSSSTACLPTSGFAPAPSPRVRSMPICKRTGASDEPSACMSVFITQNSTPTSPRSIIAFTAFDPPPPMPTTVIRAP